MYWAVLSLLMLCRDLTGREFQVDSVYRDEDHDLSVTSGPVQTHSLFAVVSDISYSFTTERQQGRHTCRMMRTGAVIIVSAVVALFGVASAVLGFMAEATRLKPDDIGVIRSRCVYPANPAFVLALCAAFLLGVAQIIASAAGGCCGCCRSGTTGFRAPKSKRFLGIFASILSWIAALIALAFYLQGAAWNAPVTHGGADGGCYYLRAGVFRRAAVLSLVATALGIVSYILLTRRPSAMTSAGYAPKPDGHYPPAVGMQQGPYGRQGYGQGQPAYPPPAQGYAGQVPTNPQYDAPPAGQGHAYGNV